MAGTVTDIFRELGVKVVWSRLQASSSASPDWIHVVLLDSERLGAVPSDVMGVTLAEPANSRSLWVLLPAVKRALGLDPVPGRRPSGLAGGLLARAIGRVVAHEVIHVLAPSIPHTEDGLMSEQLGRRRLLARRIAVDPHLRHALHTTLGAGARGRGDPTRGRVARDLSGQDNHRGPAVEGQGLR